jgi:hypothetical protein
MKIEEVFALNLTEKDWKEFWDHHEVVPSSTMQKDYEDLLTTLQQAIPVIENACDHPDANTSSLLTTWVYTLRKHLPENRPQGTSIGAI